jgi:hypothetical protein
MTLTSTRPPHQEDYGDPTKLLIKEARRQSRRRRFVNGLLVIAMIVAATLAITDGGSRSPSRAPIIGDPHGSGSTTINGSNAGTVVPGGQSVLSLWPVGGQTSWVDTENETALTHAGQGIDWTGNGGRTWRNVTPMGYSYAVGDRSIGDFYALSSTRAWLGVVSIEPGGRKGATLLATTDSGRSWSPVGSLPLNCSPMFVSALLGVCTSAPGASNAAPVEVAATFNGGRSWNKIFDNFAGMSEGYPAKDHGLPYSCDKEFSMSPPHTVWAEGWCNATQFFLYRSTDDGRRWSSEVMRPPAPPVEGGAGFTGPVVLSGRRGAVGFQEGRVSVIAVTGDGGTVFTPVYPPGPRRPWAVDIVTPTTWRLAWRSEILGTNNGGATWFAVDGNAFASRSVRYSQRWGNGAPYALHFTSRLTGWLEWETANGFTVMITRDDGRIWNTVPIPGTGRVASTTR